MSNEKVVFVVPRPIPMSLCLFTDGLRHLPFEEMLDACVEMKVEGLELGTSAYSGTPYMAFNVSMIRRLRNAVGQVIGLNLDSSHIFFTGGDLLMKTKEFTKDNCAKIGIEGAIV